jgi:exopolysaccharide biosynthesis polyprenyl glycosylphosphotransferase
VATLPTQADDPFDHLPISPEVGSSRGVDWTRVSRVTKRPGRVGGISTIPGGRWVQIVYILTDLFLVTTNAVVVFCFRFVPDWLPRLLHGHLSRLTEAGGQKEYLAFLFLYAALIVLFLQSYHLYETSRTRSTLDESLAVCKACVHATLLLTVFIYLYGIQSISRLVVGFSGVLSLVSLAGWRMWKRQIVMDRIGKGYGVRNVLVVGAGKTGQELARILKENKQLGYVVKGFLNEQYSRRVNVLGKIKDLPQVARAQFVDEIFITLPLQRRLVREAVLEARRNRLDVKLIPDLHDGLASGASLDYVGDLPVLDLHQQPMRSLALFVKRTMDVVISSVALIFVSPVLAVISVAIKLDSPGPVLYRSHRVGKKGRKFVCYKFRTMVTNADDLKASLSHLNERRGPFFKIANDPRLTRLGNWLRKYSLDELPQFWNVLKGDMSLVGPRPHPIDDYEKYNLEHLRRLDVTPGITGIWQVTARRDPSFEKNMALDVEYIEHWSVWMDFKLLVKTIPAVLRGAAD